MPEKQWTVSVTQLSKKTKDLYFVRYNFLSDARTITEAFEALLAAGFVCLRRHEGRIIPSGDFLVRVSSGEL
jgi:hypothetical protein